MVLYDTIPHLFLKLLRRKIYPVFFKSHELPQIECEENLDKSNRLIYDTLMAKAPCMIARLGANEMSVTANYLGVKNGKTGILDYIRGEGYEWWWNEHTIMQLWQIAGVWPSDHDTVARFSELMIRCASKVDILGSWLRDEYYLKDELSNAKKVHLFSLEPFFSRNPWTKALEGKRVLVVHPFEDTIIRQYHQREKLFDNADILPEFELLTYRSVQSLGGSDDYENWFDALEHMENRIDGLDFDIAIIGCGAYGFPLAAHIKQTGRKAVHLGGVTQLLFGIRGKRWDNPNNFMCKYGYYPDLINEYWCRPDKSETPTCVGKIEGGCYW